MAMSSSSSTRSLSDDSCVDEDKDDKIPQSLVQDELQLALNKVRCIVKYKIFYEFI